MAPAVQTQPLCTRHLDDDTRGLVSVIYHNIGEPLIQVPTSF